MSTALSYAKSAERPAAEFWLFDDDGTLIDLSTGSPTFSFKIGHLGSAAVLTKTSGIAGAAGAGTEPDGTPNCVVTWTTGELNLTPGRYAWQLTINTSSLDRVFYGSITILDVIS